MRRHLLVVVFAACGGLAAPRPPAQPEAVEQAKLVAWHNGTPVHFASALAFVKPSGKVEIFVSTRVHDCTTRDQEVARDELRFELTLITKLQPTGRADWRVEGFAYANLGSSTGTGAALAQTSVDARPGKHSQITVEEAGQARRLADSNEQDVLTLTGTIDALGCGDRPPRDAEPHAVQPGVIEVATHALPIVDAVLVEGVSFNRPGTRVFLSTRPIECSTSRTQDLAPWVIVISTAAELTLELQLEPGAAPIASLGGDWIGEPGGTYDGPAGELTVTPTALGAEPTFPMTLDGNAMIPRRHGADGFPVAIRGTVRARTCRIEPAR